MFNFFRRGKTAGKNEDGRPSAPDKPRTPPNDRNNSGTSVRSEKRHETTSEAPAHATLNSKDVVNLLLPPTDYGTHKTGVGAILQNIMAGNRRRNRGKYKNQPKYKNGLARAESYREISTEPAEVQTNGVNLCRSHSQLDKSYSNDGGDTHGALSAPVSASDLTYEVIPAVESKNNCAHESVAPAPAHANDARPDPASFVKELVLQKYKNKSPVQPKRQHVSLVYVSCEPPAPQHARVTQLQRDAEKLHAQVLLEEIARKIDCKLNDTAAEQMGAADSKNEEDRRHGDLENSADAKLRNDTKNDSMTAFKNDLRNDLEKLLRNERQKEEKEINDIVVTEVLNETPEEDKEDLESYKHTDIDDSKSTESPECIKKSNLKPPRSDTEGCSDDDKSDCGKKKVTFRKTIDFDDGDQQTDDEVDSSFDSLASSEEEVEDEETEEDEDVPDNDELLGGVVVMRAEDKTTNHDDGNLPIGVAQINESTELNDKSHYKPTDINTSVISDSKSELIVEHEDHSNFIERAKDNNVPEEDKYDSDKEELQRLSSDNSDSGFLECNEKIADEVKVVDEIGIESETEESEVTQSETESEEVEEEEEEEEEVEDDLGEEEEEEIVAEVIEPDALANHDQKSVVSQEEKLDARAAELTELASARCGEAEGAAALLAGYRAEIAARAADIERLKCELAAAYKESEMVRQRGRSLEEELCAARRCSADLAGKLTSHSDGAERALRSEVEAARARGAELEARVVALEKECTRLELERRAQEQRAMEAMAAAEAGAARWRAAHEAARSQAAARAERLLDDCEWKMRELERRARDAEKHSAELTAALQNAETTETVPPALQAELQQVRAQCSEQQRSLQALQSQLQRLEGREEALKIEVHRLKELLDKEAQLSKDREERHQQTVTRLEAAHAKRVETVRAELHAQHAAMRSTVERAHAERTRAALAQLRADHERDSRNHERKLREAHTRFDNLKEVLAAKEAQFEESLAEARSKSDWELLQLRHMLDKSDISHANSIEQAAQRHEAECERVNAEWAARLQATEEAAAAAAGEARQELEASRAKMEAERRDQVHRLKELHRTEMDAQWEQFMRDKEECLARMKLECRQEGEEQRGRRERDMLDEIADLKAQIATKTTSMDELSAKAAQCGRTLAVTEQELREALERERQLRSQHSEDADRIKKARNEARDEVDHLKRKCACLRKLFDDMRVKLAARDKTSAEESRLQQREIHRLKTEVARLTKILVEQSSPKLGARTRADGCDFTPEAESFLCEAGPQASESQPSAPRRKGGTLRTPELQRRTNIPEPLRPLNLTDLKPVKQDGGDGRRRAKSVDLPAVQVPVRIKQLEDLNK